MEWKSWHSTPRPRTSKAVFFSPGYPAPNTVIVCYLQTPSIIELKEKLGITAERKSLLTTILHVSPFPASYPSSSLWLVLHASLLSKNHNQVTHYCVLSFTHGRKWSLLAWSATRSHNHSWTVWVQRLAQHLKEMPQPSGSLISLVDVK